ncbi:hypothetical protein [Vibrio nigripulchritudo]|uniref:hypothetical protein n=1 Tax=Vibrio nigripulchritudo TaxID=28173 RepID=UPI0024907CBE|nr:hypothetical protein [Vibrio nigripulchritudo]BDU39211.1 hypothetical protein TUMSATVNIG2_36800 [Vibrio nigripulchritudo]BDU44931.1 hypothetical protein TUMSATVNIG3_37290 [Vibrio nigripulchritudo]
MKKIVLATAISLGLLVGCGGGSDSGGGQAAEEAFVQALNHEEVGNVSAAFALYKKSAELGHSGAQNNLGLMYLYGEGTEQNEVESLKWFSKSANQGNKYGQYNLARSYFYGWGIGKNYSQAFNWASRAKDHSGAINLLGMLHEEGKGVSKNLIQAFQLYQKAANLDNASGMFNLGRMYQYGIYVQKSFSEAKKWYELSGSRNHGGAYYQLSLMYFKEQREDESTINYYIERSASLGYSQAQFSLARAYYTGKLFDEISHWQYFDYARQWYEKAALNGHIGAKNNLALMLAMGEGGDVDYVSAYNLLKEISEEGYVTGQVNLAEFYELGHLGTNDFNKAYQWYQKAELLCEKLTSISKSCAEVYVRIGMLHERGVLDEIDYDKALHYFQKASSVSYPPAFTQLGKLYLDGFAFEKNYDLAKEWFDKAINSGSPDAGAQNYLGYMYQHGLGVEENVTLAKEYYKKAMEQDYAPAFTNMAILAGPDGGRYQLYSSAVFRYDYDPQALYYISNYTYLMNEENKWKDWLMLAANAGNVDAYHGLGYRAETVASFYDENSYKYKELYEEAALWYEKAAKRNHIQAMMKIAYLYTHGIGVVQNSESASHYYLKAARFGDSEAQFKMGQLYQSGFGVDVDHALSLYWFEKAQLQGVDSATTEIGKIHEFGLGVAQDYNKAFRYYSEAADKNEAEAQYRIGLLYRDGLGTQTNETASKAWLMQAATKGHREAHALTYSPVKEILNTTTAGAVLREDGSVITWGEDVSSDISSVKEKLTQGVVTIGNSLEDFAALKEDGSVVRWGRLVADNLDESRFASGVKELHFGGQGLAIIKEGGELITWSHCCHGMDPSSVLSKLQSGIEKVLFISSSIAALKDNGELVTWDWLDYSNVEAQLASGVVDFVSNFHANLALKNDGSIVLWGVSNGANNTEVEGELNNDVSKVVSGYDSMVAITNSGKVVEWDDEQYNVVFPSGITNVIYDNVQYLAYKGDGSVYSWASDMPVETISISGSKVKKAISSDAGFAVLKEDGTLISWERTYVGTYYNKYYDTIPNDGIKDIFANKNSFAAIKNDGSAFSWGELESSEVSDKLRSDVSKIIPTTRAFYAIKSNGEVVYWGYISDLYDRTSRPDIFLNPPQ